MKLPPQQRARIELSLPKGRRSEGVLSEIMNRRTVMTNNLGHQLKIDWILFIIISPKNTKVREKFRHYTKVVISVGFFKPTKTKVQCSVETSCISSYKRRFNVLVESVSNATSIVYL